MAGSSVSDDQLIERLDFVGQARRRGSWAPVDLRTPVLVGLPDTRWLSVPASVLEAAMTVGTVTRSQEEDRQVLLDSYGGFGVVEVDGVHWWVHGHAAMENQNHDFVAGRVSGHPVEPVAPRTLELISERLRLAGETQAALTCAHFGGLDLAPFDQLDAEDAIDDLLWKMSQAGWREIDVLGVTIDAVMPIFVQVQVAPPAGATADAAVPVWTAGDRWFMGRVPRAGAHRLSGFAMTFPGPSGGDA